MPTNPRIFLLRHGHSLANERGLIASRIATGGEAYGLTPEGMDQVSRSVREAVANGSLRSPAAVLASPLLRARESAAIAADSLGVVASQDARLRERDFGELELCSDALYSRVWEADLEDPTHRRWCVESVADVLQRAGRVVDECLRRADVATVVLCTHGDVASALLCAARGVPLAEHRRVGAMDTGILRELTAIEAFRGGIRRPAQNP